MISDPHYFQGMSLFRALGKQVNVGAGRPNRIGGHVVVIVFSKMSVRKGLF